METIYINTPIGIMELQGNESGISKICLFNEAIEISTKNT